MEQHAELGLFGSRDRKIHNHSGLRIVAERRRNKKAVSAVIRIATVVASIAVPQYALAINLAGSALSGGITGGWKGALIGAGTAAISAGVGKVVGSFVDANISTPVLNTVNATDTAAGGIAGATLADRVPYSWDLPIPGAAQLNQAFNWNIPLLKTMTLGDAVGGVAGSIVGGTAKTTVEDLFRTGDTAKVDQAFKNAGMTTAQAEQAKTEMARKRQNDITNAYIDALNAANKQVTDRGLNPNDLEAVIADALNKQRDAIPSTAYEGYNTFFRPQAIDTALATEEQGRKTKYLSSIDQLFGPQYAQSAIPDTMDDPYINDILGTQRREAQSGLETSKARNTISPQGYMAGISALDKQETTGRNTLQNLGGSVLGRYRGDIDSIINSARTDASNYSLASSPWSIEPYQQRIADSTAKATTNLRNDISSLAPTSVFNTQDILNTAGGAQGPQNRGVLDALMQRRTSAQRGLGTTGAF